MYSSALGRFLQTDTVEYMADLNLYAYVDNDPLDVTDPNGQGKCGDATRIGKAPDSICGGTQDPNNPNAGAGSPFNKVTHPDGSGSKHGSAGISGQLPNSVWLGDHDYPIENEICPASWHCTEQQVGKILSEVRGSIPGNTSDAPIVSGREYTVYVFGVPGGEIKSYVGQGGLTVANITEKLHPLYNGWIQRVAIERNGAWYVRTHGSGTNFYGGMPSALANEKVLGPLMFNELDKNVRQWLYQATHQ